MSRYTGQMPCVKCPACMHDWQWDDYYDIDEGTERKCPFCRAEIEVEWAEAVMHVSLVPKRAREAVEGKG